MSYDTLHLLLVALAETVAMVAVSGTVSGLFGIPLGIVLYLTRPLAMMEHKTAYRVLGSAVNIGRSIPFIILMVSLIPMTRLIVGTTIGTAAASVPLSVSAIPFVARLVETALGQSMGATSTQIVRKILLPESTPRIIQGMTVTWVSLVGYSAMAGAIGGGGLGDLAIRYGYQRFDTAVMVMTVVTLVMLVQTIQFAGDRAAKHYDRTHS